MPGHHIGPDRILSIDTMRGFAMILVILQHCYQVVDPRLVPHLADLAVYLPTRMASVAFMAVSGMMISYFLFSKPDPASVRLRFARRALLLLFGAHLAIHAARFFYYPPVGLESFLHHLTHEWLITDTIGLSLLIAPLVITRTSLTARAMIAAALLIATPLVIIFWRPESGLPLILKIALFGGPAGSTGLSVAWPLVPWLGIFLIGTLVGQPLARVRQGRLPIPTLTSALHTLAAALFVLGLALTLGYKILKPWLGVSDPVNFDALYPSRTTTLLPIYLAVLLWIFALLIDRIDRRGHYGRLSWALSVFGRTSLFTYVTQFLFVHSVPGLLGVQWQIGFGGFVLLFLFSLPASWLLSYSYGRFRGWLAPDDFSRLKLLHPAPTVPRGETV